MIVDTSALMAILLDEPDAERCIAALEGQAEVMISAGTLAEAMIVAARRNIGGEMTALVEGLGFEIVSVSGAGSAKVAEAYARWGKGIHAASLNFGDCFAYALARELGRPLLFVGDEFSKTDIKAA
ncbi:type II toxin-antitoxin system VapC family toxin [Phenylobacterium sp.]|uniref:type II toxin-antitoxin system VapC family toxin n=1 Tax=Phenylobacterium sp. TaxID=1871053 RepID=UPI00289BCC48|nr:type II toxin-antitoxin system VapC family toxin [Phenylobacterium sp.]